MTTSLSDRLEIASRSFPFGIIKKLLQEAALATTPTSDWVIELNEVWPTVEDIDRTLLESRIVLNPQPGHFDLKIKYKGQLVFFMTSSPRPIDDPEVPYGDLHVYIHTVEGNKMPLRHLLDRADRIS